MCGGTLLLDICRILIFFFFSILALLWSPKRFISFPLLILMLLTTLKKKTNFGYLCFPGDAVLRQESQLCLTATSLVFLNQCFDIVNSGKLSVCDIFYLGASIREEMILWKQKCFINWSDCFCCLIKLWSFSSWHNNEFNAR